MATKNYTTKTAALKATKADINKLDAKKMLLNGKNILDYISDSEFNSYDTRDPQLKNDELDLWNTDISLSDNGHIEVKPFEHDITTVTDEQLSTIRGCAKVINNEVLDANDNHLMYWQTDGLTIGYGSREVHLTKPIQITKNFNCSIFYLNAMVTTITSDIQIFNSDLSSLTNGKDMFHSCSNLTTFTSDLSSLTDGNNMFHSCSSLTTFTSDLSSLTDGGAMFSSCSSLTTFTSDLSSLTNGSGMFKNCDNLTTFDSNLSSLTNGGGVLTTADMFYGCKLDAPSVANIVHTLPQRYSKPAVTGSIGHIHIGIGCNNTAEDQLLFAQECDCETWQELLDDFSAKNWGVQLQCNGRPTTTYNMRRGETLPIYAKLEEVTEDEDYAYTSADGSKFYNIHYFHSTNGSTEGYDVFSSLEEAISTYNVTPKN